MYDFFNMAIRLLLFKRAHHCAQQIDRQSTLQTSRKENSDRIPFTLVFHPLKHAVNCIILKIFKLLENDQIDPDLNVRTLIFRGSYGVFFGTFHEHKKK